MVKHALEQAAACIATVVEAEHPTNHPTLKGLIHEDLDETTEEVRWRIQSLESKLVASLAKNNLGGGKKKMMKTKGTVTTPTKNSKPTGQSLRLKKKAPTSPKTNSHHSPTGKSNVSTTAAKNPKKKKSRIKSSGNGRGKKTVAPKKCKWRNGESGRVSVFSQT